jgi:hypothetical protein
MVNGLLYQLRWWERDDFQKRNDQGENSFAKSRVSRDWTPFQKTPIRLRSGLEPARYRLAAHEH